MSVQTEFPCTCERSITSELTDWLVKTVITITDKRRWNHGVSPLEATTDKFEKYFTNEAQILSNYLQGWRNNITTVIRKRKWTHWHQTWKVQKKDIQQNLHKQWEGRQKCSLLAQDHNSLCPVFSTWPTRQRLFNIDGILCSACIMFTHLRDGTPNTGRAWRCNTGRVFEKCQPRMSRIWQSGTDDAGRVKLLRGCTKCDRRCCWPDAFITFYWRFMINLEWSACAQTFKLRGGVVNQHCID